MKRTLSTFALLAGLASAANVNILTIGAATAEAETITIGSTVLEIDLGGGVTTGRTAVNLTSSAVAATGTLTLTANVTANDTCTVGATVYTFVALTTGSQVLIGASASATLDNLIAAINAAAGAGTTYGSAITAHPTVTAAAGAGDTMVVTARTRGTGGNSIATTETFTGAGNVFGAATLASGANPSAANSITGIAAALNAITFQTGVQAIAITGGILIVDRSTRGGQSCTETLAGSGNAWAAAATFGAGSVSDIPEIPIVFSRTVTAAEATATQMAFGLAFTPSEVIVQVRTSAGVIKAWDGKLTLGTNHILLASDAGTDLAENDVVTVLATV